MHATATKTTHRKRNLEAVFETDTTLVQNIQLNITFLHFPFLGRSYVESRGCGRTHAKAKNSNYD